MRRTSQVSSGVTRCALAAATCSTYTSMHILSSICVEVKEELCDLFPSFLAMAEALMSAAAEDVQRAGGSLYVELFAASDDGYVRQVRCMVLPQRSYEAARSMRNVLWTRQQGVEDDSFWPH